MQMYKNIYMKLLAQNKKSGSRQNLVMSLRICQRTCVISLFKVRIPTGVY